MKTSTLLILLFLAVLGCKKSSTTPDADNDIVGDYTLHTTLRKMELVNTDAYNYELSVWLTAKDNPDRILKISEKLPLTGQISSTLATMPIAIELQPGSYITRKIFTLNGTVKPGDKIKAANSYTGKTVSTATTTMTEPHRLTRIKVVGKGFADGNGKRFIPWGVNYTNPDQIPLMDDEWMKPEKWEIIKEDFREMSAMDLNVVRIHLQYHHFMTSPTQPNTASLKRLQELATLAGTYGLYLDVTGLGCYHKQDTPAWYSSMNETDRWATQAIFWKSIAQALKEHQNIFCFNLMNEPIAPGSKGTDYLPGGALEGYYFVQLISIDPAGRNGTTIMRQWIQQLSAAIRAEDNKALITVGFIGWGKITPYADLLDFNSGHTYPSAIPAKLEQNFIDNNQTDKPLIIEEIWPLSGSIEVNKQFIVMNKDKIAGVVSHYFGKTIDHLEGQTDNVSTITRDWYQVFTRDINPYYNLPAQP